MAESPDDIVGHKTFRDGESYRHEPLTREEADRIIAATDAAKEKRAAAFPDAEAAVRGLWDAWYRLKEIGWKDPRYAPADGRLKTIIEIGSTGLHKAHCKPREGRDGEKWWWIPDDGYCPTTPLLYLPDEQEVEEDRVRGEAARARWLALRSDVPTVGNSETKP